MSIPSAAGLRGGADAPLAATCALERCARRGSAVTAGNDGMGFFAPLITTDDDAVDPRA